MLAFDARGRGLSDEPESGYTMADHAADLLGALDALGLERVHLFGHSFGGLLTYYVAANHPERVETAVVLDAPADLDLAILDQTNGSIRPRCNPAHIRAVIEGELEIDWPATIERVTCPTLIVRATDPFGPPGSGPILTAESAQRAAARLQDGTLAGFRGNHITFIFGSHARDVVEEIVSFDRRPQRGLKRQRPARVRVVVRSDGRRHDRAISPTGVAPSSRDALRGRA